MFEAQAGLLQEGLALFGIQAPPQAVEGILRHLELVVDWNQRMNLTALTDERDMILKHVIDSVTLLQVAHLEPGLRVVDVGTGAGFPGVTLKCLVPGIDLVLVESLSKRCRFLKAVGTDVIAHLPGNGAYEVVWGRAEDVGQKAEYREQFDVVVARAVAELRVLSELCLPLCKVGGEFVALKGPSAAEELTGAAKAVGLLGGQVVENREIELPGGAGRRSLVRIKKVASTPRAYPRRAGTPEKAPL